MAIRETKSQLEKRIDELMNSSGGGTQHGVGEWLDNDHTIEIFNLYEDIDQTHTKNSAVLKYDHVEGYNNHADWQVISWTPTVGANHISGSNNTVISTEYADVSGNNNTVTQTDPTIGSTYGMFVRGEDNTVTLSSCGVTVGANLTVTAASFAAVFGYGNTVVNNNHAPLIFGRGASDTTGTLILAGGAGGNVITVDYQGIVTAKRYDTTNADYAEYCEWADGNADNEDRMGLLVEFVGDKIVPAQGFDFIGAISARASVIGNAYENYWHKKYVTDVFGRMMLDDDGKPLINPEYDENQVYIPRSQRPEWDVAGLVGRIIVCDNGHCEPGCHVSARRGIACPTFSVTRGLCLKRIDDNHIEILIK